MSYRKWDDGHPTHSSHTSTHRSALLQLVYPHSWGLCTSFTTLRVPSAADIRIPVTGDDTHVPLADPALGSAGWATFTGTTYRSGWRRLARTSGFGNKMLP